MKVEITWLRNGFKQIKTLTHCRKGHGELTMNSPIYEAIQNRTFFIDIGYGKHYFTVRSLLQGDGRYCLFCRKSIEIVSPRKRDYCDYKCDANHQRQKRIEILINAMIKYCNP